MKIPVWIALGTFLLDRASKCFAEYSLQYAPNARMEMIAGVVRMTYRRNTGAAFSALDGNNYLLLILTCALVALVGVMLWKMREKHPMIRTGLALVLAGGVGNILDRVLYGYVIDFIEVLFVRFAVFNIADCAICVGVALTVIGFRIEERREKRDAAR